MIRILLLVALLVTPTWAQTTQPTPMIGFDGNYMLDMEQHGKAWRDSTGPVDPFKTLAQNGCTHFRLRLWTGEEGMNGLKYAIETAQRAKAAGLKPYLVLFLSENWSDMVKQPLPAIWKDASDEDKLKKIEEYAVRVTQEFKKSDIDFDLVEIGNEIDFGICGVFEEEWPKRVSLEYMQSRIWPHMSPIILAAQRGVKQTFPQAKFTLHLAQWENLNYCIAFWKFMLAQGVQLDYAGLSYFPTSTKASENRPLRVIESRVDEIFRAIDRPVMICETGFPSSPNFGGQFADWNKPVDGYDLTEPGQAKWLADTLAMVRKHPHLAGFYYWSPEWHGGGIWDAFALFDSAGQARPALQSFHAAPATQPSASIPTNDALSLVDIPPTNPPLNIYFGNLHAHTSYSDGVGTPAEAFAYARDVAKIDFLAITEHNHLMGGDKATPEARRALYVGPADTALIPAANRFNQDGQFVAIYGQEFSSMSKGNHVNIFDIPEVIDVPNGKYDDLLHWIDKHRASGGSIPIVQMNHPGLGIRMINRLQYGRDDFGDDAGWVKNMGAVTSLIEVVNGEPEKGQKDNRPPQVFDDYYRWYLQFGFKLAPVGSQDNHTATWGNATDTRTAILAPALTRADLFAAMRARHVYATQDKNLRVVIHVNGHLCGDIISSAEPLNELNIQAQIEDPDEPTATYSIEAFTGTIGSVREPKMIKSYLWKGNTPARQVVQLPGIALTEPNQFVYFRINQTSNATTDTTWTAPVWLELGQMK